MPRLLYDAGSGLKSIYIGPVAQIFDMVTVEQPDPKNPGETISFPTKKFRDETQKEMIDRHFEQALLPDLPWQHYMICPEEFETFDIDRLSVDWETEQVSDIGQLSPVITVEDVKAECVRRRKLAAGLAIDAKISDLDYRVVSMLSEAVGIERISLKRELRFEEQSRLDELTHIDRQLKAILVRSNAIQAMTPIPEDFSDDRWWQ